VDSGGESSNQQRSKEMEIQIQIEIGKGDVGPMMQKGRKQSLTICCQATAVPVTGRCRNDMSGCRRHAYTLKLGASLICRYPEAQLPAQAPAGCEETTLAAPSLAVSPLRHDGERVECAASDPRDCLVREGNNHLRLLRVLQAPLLQQHIHRPPFRNSVSCVLGLPNIPRARLLH